MSFVLPYHELSYS